MQNRILEALARYHYLTTPQLRRLLYPAATAEQDIKNKNVAVTKQLLRFGPSPKAEINVIQFYRRYHPNIYFLTRKGAAVVGERWQDDGVFYPRVAKDTAFSSDAPHRSLVIGCRVSLDLHAAQHGGSVVFFDPYYRCTGANHSAGKQRLRKLTRIDFPPEAREQAGKAFFWPDAIFRLDAPKGSLLCALELQRQHDTKESEKKLELHLTAIEHGLVADKYRLREASRALFVFGGESALQCFLERLRQRDDLEGYERLVACSTALRLEKDFQDWFYVWQGKATAGGLY